LNCDPPICISPGALMKDHVPMPSFYGRDRISLTFCSWWPWVVIFLISASCTQQSLWSFARNVPISFCLFVYFNLKETFLMIVSKIWFCHCCGEWPLI
jgi:hypothetical protein